MMWRFLFICLLSITCIGKTLAQSTSAALPFGINMAGAEFGFNNLPGVYNTDYTYPTAENIAYFASKGFKLMRLPFRWERVQQTLNGDLNIAELARMEKFVDDCAKQGIQVILDMHNYGRYRLNKQDEIVGGPKVNRINFSDVWKKLAVRFSTKNNIYGYDIMNQPNKMGSYTWWPTAQDCVNSIRQVDTKTPIIISGNESGFSECWAQENDDLKKITDPSNKLIFGAHTFFDRESYGGYNPPAFDSANVSLYVGIDRVKCFVEWLQKNNKRGMVTSFGVPDNDNRWLIAMDIFLKYLRDHCVNALYWAGGPWWGNYNLSVQSTVGGVDRPQMAILTKYLSTSTVCQSAIPTVVTNPFVSLSPNPFKDYIEVNQGNCINYHTIEIYSLFGKKVLEATLQRNKTSINASALKAANYIAVVKGNGFSQSMQIIKNK